MGYVILKARSQVFPKLPALGGRARLNQPNAASQKPSMTVVFGPDALDLKPRPPGTPWAEPCSRRVRRDAEPDAAAMTAVERQRRSRLAKKGNLQRSHPAPARFLRAGPPVPPCNGRDPRGWCRLQVAIGRLGRYHDAARATDADRARRTCRVRARPDRRSHERGPRPCQGARHEVRPSAGTDGASARGRPCSVFAMVTRNPPWPKPTPCHRRLSAGLNLFLISAAATPPY